MNTRTKNLLMEGLSNYGYPLLQPAGELTAGEVLEGLLEEKDTRLLEGFPVVLANVVERGEPLGWEAPAWKPSDLTSSAKILLPYLLAMSLFLFKGETLKPEVIERVEKLLAKCGEKKVLDEVQKSFFASQPFTVEGIEFSPERLKNTFKTYHALKKADFSLEQKKKEMQRELFLSRLFTSRQKILLRKKLEGVNLSKTEGEYYSRVLKKRLQALASDDLHAFAQKLLER